MSFYYSIFPQRNVGIRLLRFRINSIRHHNLRHGDCKKSVSLFTNDLHCTQPSESIGDTWKKSPPKLRQQCEPSYHLRSAQKRRHFALGHISKTTKSILDSSPKMNDVIGANNHCLCGKPISAKYDGENPSRTKPKLVRMKTNCKSFDVYTDSFSTMMPSEPPPFPPPAHFIHTKKTRYMQGTKARSLPFRAKSEDNENTKHCEAVLLKDFMRHSFDTQQPYSSESFYSTTTKRLASNQSSASSMPCSSRVVLLSKPTVNHLWNCKRTDFSSHYSKQSATLGMSHELLPSSSIENEDLKQSCYDDSISRVSSSNHSQLRLNTMTVSPEINRPRSLRHFSRTAEFSSKSANLCRKSDKDYLEGNYKSSEVKKQESQSFDVST